MCIDRFFTLIKDGTWHSIDELAHQLGLPTNKLTEFSKFLYKHGIVKYEDKTRRIKIEPEWKLLPEEK